MFTISWNAVNVYGNIIVAELKYKKTKLFGFLLHLFKQSSNNVISASTEA